MEPKKNKTMKILGISSRINHPQYGKGVVTNVTSKHYWVTFIESGLETIDINSQFEIIEAAEDDVDTVSRKQLGTNPEKMERCHRGGTHSRQMERGQTNLGTRRYQSKSQRSAH
jgi:hypothetical protein